MSRQVRCPQCHQKVPYEGNPHRPFCSERCRNIDLGIWAVEGYVIPGNHADSEESTVSSSQVPEKSVDPEKE